MTFILKIRTPLLLAIISLLLALFLSLGFLGQLNFNIIISSTTEWLLLFFCILFIGVSFFWMKRKKSIDIFEFPIWISIILIIQVVVSFWFAYTDPKLIFPNLRYDTDRWIRFAIFITGWGLLSIWAGYIFGYFNMHLEKNKRTNINLKPRISLIIVIWIILWITFITAGLVNFLGWGGSSIGEWSNYLAFILLLYDIVTIILLLHHFKKPSLIGWIWVILVIASILFIGIVIGSRGAALYFVNLLIVAFYAVGKYKWQYVVLGIIALGLFAPAATEFRSLTDRYKSPILSDRLSSVTRSVSTSLDVSFNDRFSFLFELYGRRQGSFLPVTASVVQLHPKVLGYVYDEMIEEFTITSIPRIIWPSKPVGVSKLYSISTLYTGAEEETTFSEIGFIADSYRVGGTAFVFFFCFLLGLIFSIIYKLARTSGRIDFLVLYIILLSQLSYNEPLLDILLFSIRTAILIWIFIRILHKKDALVST